MIQIVALFLLGVSLLANAVLYIRGSSPLGNGGIQVAIFMVLVVCGLAAINVAGAEAWIVFRVSVP